MFNIDFIIDMIGTEMCKYDNVSVVYQVIPSIPNEVKLSLRKRWPFIAAKNLRVVRDDHLIRLVSNDHCEYGTTTRAIMTCDIRDPNFNIPQFAKAVNGILHQKDWFRIVSFTVMNIIIAVVGYLHFRY